MKMLLPIVVVLCAVLFGLTDAGVDRRLRYHRSIFGGRGTTTIPNIVLLGLMEQPVPVAAPSPQQLALAASSSAYAPPPVAASHLTPAVPYTVGQQSSYNPAPQQSYMPAPVSYQSSSNLMAPQTYMAPSAPQMYAAPSQPQSAYSSPSRPQQQTAYPQQQMSSYQQSAVSPQRNYVDSTNGNNGLKQESISETSSSNSLRSAVNGIDQTKSQAALPI